MFGVLFSGEHAPHHKQADTQTERESWQRQQNWLFLRSDFLLKLQSARAYVECAARAADPLVERATGEIIAGARPRHEVQRDIRAKERARETLAKRYRSATLPEVPALGLHLFSLQPSQGHGSILAGSKLSWLCTGCAEPGGQGVAPEGRFASSQANGCEECV